MSTYTVISKIVIQQVPTSDFPNRNDELTIKFLESYSGESSWESLTQTMKIVLPKRVALSSKKYPDRKYYLAGIKTQQSNIGGYLADSGEPQTGKPIPTLLRGDIITFDVGYSAVVGNKTVTYFTGQTDPTGVYKSGDSTVNGGGVIPHLFKGFISKVNPRMPFTIECQDMMWLMSYIPTEAKCYGYNDTLTDIVGAIINNARKPDIDGNESLLSKYERLLGEKVTICNFSKTNLVFNVQNFITQRGDLASLLQRIKHQYHTDSWFRGSELRIGLTHYIPNDAKDFDFQFQKNILDGDKLAFKRKDDVPLSCIVRTNYGIETGATTKDGKKVIKQANTEILVYNNAGQFKYIKKEKGRDFAANDVGKRYTLNITTHRLNKSLKNANGVIVDADDTEALFQMGVTFLKRYYFDGVEGSFSTFGAPFVRHGDVVNLTNPVLPEMNGKYMVKSVDYSGGESEGLRQNITLGFKITSLNDINTFNY